VRFSIALALTGPYTHAVLEMVPVSKLS
jgi:hypothetical protein